MPKFKLTSFVGIAFLFLLWEIIAILLQKPMLPTPISVFITFFNLLPTLAQHAGISVFRIVISMTISILLAVPIGILAGYFPAVDKIVSPMVYVIYPIPKISLLPIAMLFLGLGDASKILIMVLILTFQIMITIRDGVKKIPKEYFLPYLVAGCNFKFIARKVILPGTLPDLFTGLRNSFAAALSVLFFSESYGTQLGMGYYILDAWLRLNYRQMYSGIVMLSFVGVLIYFALDFLQKKTVKGYVN